MRLRILIICLLVTTATVAQKEVVEYFGDYAVIKKNDRYAIGIQSTTGSSEDAQVITAFIYDSVWVDEYTEITIAFRGDLMDLYSPYSSEVVACYTKPAMDSIIPPNEDSWTETRMLVFKQGDLYGVIYFEETETEMRLIYEPPTFTAIGAGTGYEDPQAHIMKAYRDEILVRAWPGYDIYHPQNVVEARVIEMGMDEYWNEVRYVYFDGQHYAYFDPNNYTVSPFIYDSIVLEIKSGMEMITVKQDGKWGTRELHYDEWYAAPVYDELDVYGVDYEIYCVADIGGKKGIVQNQQYVRLDFVFDEIVPDLKKDRVQGFYTRSGDYWGYVNISNKKLYVKDELGYKYPTERLDAIFPAQDKVSIKPFTEDYEEYYDSTRAFMPLNLLGADDSTFFLDEGVNGYYTYLNGKTGIASTTYNGDGFCSTQLVTAYDSIQRHVDWNEALVRTYANGKMGLAYTDADYAYVLCPAIFDSITIHLTDLEDSTYAQTSGYYYCLAYREGKVSLVSDYGWRPYFFNELEYVEGPQPLWDPMLKYSKKIVEGGYTRYTYGFITPEIMSPEFARIKFHPNFIIGSNTDGNSNIVPDGVYTAEYEIYALGSGTSYWEPYPHGNEHIYQVAMVGDSGLVYCGSTDTMMVHNDGSLSTPMVVISSHNDTCQAIGWIRVEFNGLYGMYDAANETWAYEPQYSAIDFLQDNGGYTTTPDGERMPAYTELNWENGLHEVPCNSLYLRLSEGTESTTVKVR